MPTIILHFNRFETGKFCTAGRSRFALWYRIFYFSPALNWLVAVLFFLMAGSAVGESVLAASGYVTHYWLREDGLPQNTVTAVVQTQDGYIWISSYNGLARFDGVHFTKFDSGSTPGLASSRVTSLFESDDGALWIGHEGGDLTRYADGKFETRPVNAKWRHGKITCIVADESGDIWLQNDDGLVARARDGLVLTPEPGIYTGNLQLTCNKQGNVWVGRNGRISMLHQGILTPLALEAANTNTAFIGIGAARDGGLWLVTTNQVREWKDGGWTNERGIPPFEAAPLTKLIETQKGTLVGASSDHGLALMFPDGRSSVFSRATGFSSDWIEALCEDREEGLWVGTGGAGLALVRESCVQKISPPDAWQGRAILSVYADREGLLWVGTEGAGAYCLQNGSWTNYSFKEGLANPYVWSLAEDNAGNLSAGTWNGGLFVRRDGHFEPAPGMQQVAVPMTALLAARDGGLWIGTGMGLLRYDAAGKISWVGKQENLANNFVRCIAEQRDGAIWFDMAGKGLFRLQDGGLKSFRKTDGLPGDYVQCLHLDESGVIWIGTFGGGLCRFKAGNFATIGEKQGLSDNVICDIEDDGHGYFWMSSYNGIIRASKSDLNQCADGTKNSVQCLTYGMSDGMPTLECTGGLQPAGCKTADGRLWFGTSRGLVVVNPLGVNANTLPPPVTIEKLLVDGEPAMGEDSLVSRLEISPGQHRIEFQYAGLSYTAPEKVRFKHRLDGLDADWIEAGTRRAVDYNYIPPGNYTFHVIACNNDGVWNENGASVAFTILPYFWQTVWFRALALAGLVLVVGGGAWYGTRRRMRRKLERVERHRALERERARIAKDIHDDLGASLTRINLMSQSARRAMSDGPQTVKNLDQICDTARQLTRAMDEIVWAVDPQHDTLDSLASYLGKLIHELLGDSGIRCRLDFPIYLPTWLITAEVRHNLFLAVKEALHNILKHSGATEVQISFKLESSALTVGITDNGCGFDPAGKDWQPKARRNGLMNMRQRLKEIGGSCEIRSQPGQGAAVVFSLPVVETISTM
jgi:signal transduction histidine kinase/ligand-binding sensor domain-containing protein